MPDPILLVTGSAGLIGSQDVRHFAALGWQARDVLIHEAGLHIA